jgi:predicted ribosome quality control (RQC) complex YloA/Tae2 family protein
MDPSNNYSNNLPNPEELHEHINSLMEGKLGRLASEITEETLHEFTDMSGATSVNDVFQKLFQNPGKLMGLIKKLGSSLDEKIKSGEIKESELMEEAASIMEKMQNVPGMKNMKGLLEKMGLSGLGGNGKIDLNAMRNAMGGNIRKTKMKERMKEKLKARQAKKGEDKDAQIRILQQQLSNAKKITENLQNLGSTELSKKSKKKRKKKKKRNKARNKK